MERPWDNEDILREQKRADKAYEQGYKAGYRKARIDILGEAALAEEKAYDDIVKSIIADITK